MAISERSSMRACFLTYDDPFHIAYALLLCIQMHVLICCYACHIKVFLFLWKTYIAKPHDQLFISNSM